MRLKNKKTGEIVILIDHILDNYKTLAELSEEWEIYKPKEWWYLDVLSKPIEMAVGSDELKHNLEAIGNHFSSEEEAEKAVGKLRALKRLKDEGFRIDGWHYQDPSTSGIAIGINASFDASKMEILHPNYIEDLTTCFGEMF